MKTNNLKILKLKECRKPQISTFLLWLCWIAFCIFIIVLIANSMNAPKPPDLYPDKNNNETDLFGPVSVIVIVSLVAAMGVVGIINALRNLFTYTAMMKKGRKYHGKVKKAVRHENATSSGRTYSKYHLECQITDADYVPSPVFCSKFFSYDPSSSVGDSCEIYILEGKKALNYLLLLKQ